MKVLCKNKLWDLEMPYLLFESLKRDSKSHEVELTESCQSCYKECITVSICEVEDYSIARNIQALSLN